MHSFFIVLNILTFPLPNKPSVYTISAQAARLKNKNFSIQLPTKWYIVTLLPFGCNEFFKDHILRTMVHSAKAIVVKSKQYFIQI